MEPPSGARRRSAADRDAARGGGTAWDEVLHCADELRRLRDVAPGPRPAAALINWILPSLRMVLPVEAPASGVAAAAAARADVVDNVSAADADADADAAAGAADDAAPAAAPPPPPPSSHEVRAAACAAAASMLVGSSLVECVGLATAVYGVQVLLVVAFAAAAADDASSDTSTPWKLWTLVKSTAIAALLEADGGGGRYTRRQSRATSRATNVMLWEAMQLFAAVAPRGADAAPSMSVAPLLALLLALSSAPTPRHRQDGAAAAAALSTHCAGVMHAARGASAARRTVTFASGSEEYFPRRFDDVESFKEWPAQPREWLVGFVAATGWVFIGRAPRRVLARGRPADGLEGTSGRKSLAQRTRARARARAYWVETVVPAMRSALAALHSKARVVSPSGGSGSAAEGLRRLADTARARALAQGCLTPPPAADAVLAATQLVLAVLDNSVLSPVPEALASQAPDALAARTTAAALALLSNPPGTDEEVDSTVARTRTLVRCAVAASSTASSAAVHGDPQHALRGGGGAAVLSYGTQSRADAGRAGLRAILVALAHARACRDEKLEMVALLALRQCRLADVCSDHSADQQRTLAACAEACRSVAAVAAAVVARTVVARTVVAAAAATTTSSATSRRQAVAHVIDREPALGPAVAPYLVNVARGASPPPPPPPLVDVTLLLLAAAGSEAAGRDVATVVDALAAEGALNERSVFLRLLAGVDAGDAFGALHANRIFAYGRPNDEGGVEGFCNCEMAVGSGPLRVAPPVAKIPQRSSSRPSRRGGRGLLPVPLSCSARSGATYSWCSACAALVPVEPCPGVFFGPTMTTEELPRVCSCAARMAWNRVRRDGDCGFSSAAVAVASLPALRAGLRLTAKRSADADADVGSPIAILSAAIERLATMVGQTQWLDALADAAIALRGAFAASVTEADIVAGGACDDRGAGVRLREIARKAPPQHDQLLWVREYVARSGAEVGADECYWMDNDALEYCAWLLDAIIFVIDIDAPHLPVVRLDGDTFCRAVHRPIDTIDTRPIMIMRCGNSHWECLREQPTGGPVEGSASSSGSSSGPPAVLPRAAWLPSDLPTIVAAQIAHSLSQAFSLLRHSESSWAFARGVGLVPMWLVGALTRRCATLHARAAAATASYPSPHSSLLTYLRTSGLPPEERGGGADDPWSASSSSAAPAAAAAADDATTMDTTTETDAVRAFQLFQSILARMWVVIALPPAHAHSCAYHGTTHLPSHRITLLMPHSALSIRPAPVSIRYDANTLGEDYIPLDDVLAALGQSTMAAQYTRAVVLAMLEEMEANGDVMFDAEEARVYQV